MKRLFRGLRTEPPRPSYDAVVIGSGIGGLVCANLLQRAGLATLLVEQHYMVGGYCSTFRRGGYTFDASTHFYPLLGNPETFTGRLLGDLGVETRWVRMDPVDVFHFPDGTRFTVPVELDEYLRRVKAEFPHQTQAVDAFFEAAREAYSAGLLGYFRDHRSPRLERWERWTVRDALDHFFADAKLKLLLTADCPHWGSPPCRTSFVFDSMLRLSYFLGNYYPAGGSQAFADELARCFEARGGEVLMSTAVRRITVHEGRATGVEIETTRGPLRARRQVRAGFVVSNADLRLTLDELLAEAPIADGWRREVARLRPTFPCFLSHLGLRGVAAADLEAAQGYYWADWNPDEVGRGALVGKIFVPTLYAPDLAPPGGQVVILQKVLDMDVLEVADWAAHKAGVESFLFALLERALPGIGAHVVVHSSATARTAQRFTFNHAGAMLGWEMSPDQLGARRPDIRGPLENLFLVGHWTRPGGGVTPVIVSAMQVAEAIAPGAAAAGTGGVASAAQG
jgi:phytoene dehydrogenase-like protein